MPETTPKQAMEVALMRSLVALDNHIPVKGIGRTPGMKCIIGLLVDWEALAAMEITPELEKGYLTLLASGEAAGERIGCDGGQLNTDEPGFQVWERKLRDKFNSLSEVDKATWRETVFPMLKDAAMERLRKMPPEKKAAIRAQILLNAGIDPDSHPDEILANLYQGRKAGDPAAIKQWESLVRQGVAYEEEDGSMWMKKVEE